jgi:hypothetical protein
MQDHAVIGKFVGLWPSEKILGLVDQHQMETKGSCGSEVGIKGILHNYFYQLGR